MKAKLSTREKVLKLATPIAEELGYELVDAGPEKETSGVYLRVYLDKPGGVTLNDCEAFHRKLQPLVEHIVYDFLEVSSPGIDRPLHSERDLEKAKGSLVELKLYKPMDGKKLLTGKLSGWDVEGYTITVNENPLTVPRKAVALLRRSFDADSVLTEVSEYKEEIQDEQSET